MKTQADDQRSDVEVMTAETSFRVSDPDVEIQESSSSEEPIIHAVDVPADDFHVIMKTQEDWVPKLCQLVKRKIGSGNIFVAELYGTARIVRSCLMNQ